MTPDLQPCSPAPADPHLPRHLYRLVLTAQGIDDFLQQAVEALTAIGPALSVGLMVVRDGYPTAVAGSDERASRCDEIQYSHGEGPCLEAMQTGRPVLLTDLTQELRFDPFRQCATELGVRCSLSLPLDGGEHAVGALNLYSREPRAFGPAEQAYGMQVARDAALALDLAVRTARLTEAIEQLQAALSSRSTIDQALGVIMAQNRCNADAAFGILRAASQNRNVKLRTIAVGILSSVSSAPPSAGDLPSQSHP